MSYKRHNAKYIVKPATAAEMIKALKISKKTWDKCLKYSLQVVKDEAKLRKVTQDLVDAGVWDSYPRGWLGYRCLPTGEIYEAVDLRDGHILTISPTRFFKGKYWEVANDTLEPLTKAAEVFLRLAQSEG